MNTHGATLNRCEIVSMYAGLYVSVMCRELTDLHTTITLQGPATVHFKCVLLTFSKFN